MESLTEHEGSFCFISELLTSSLTIFGVRTNTNSISVSKINVFAESEHVFECKVNDKLFVTFNFDKETLDADCVMPDNTHYGNDMFFHFQQTCALMLQTETSKAYAYFKRHFGEYVNNLGDKKLVL